MIKLAIITGVAGAGKTYVLSSFEENQYYIIDNVPLNVVPSLFSEFLSNEKKYHKVALSVRLEDAGKVFALAKKQSEFEINFLGLDCSKEVLLERFRLTRRVHPLEPSGLTLEECIAFDKKNIGEVKELFTNYIDTSKLTTRQLRKILNANIFSNKEARLNVNFVSFGIKKCIPQDIETMIDVRTLPNPYWVSELKDLTGLDKEVHDYIFSFKETEEFLEHLTNYLDFYLAKASEADRKTITIGICCSGGQHRSVVVAEYLKDYYKDIYNTHTSHRELGE